MGRPGRGAPAEQMSASETTTALIDDLRRGSGRASSKAPTPSWTPLKAICATSLDGAGSVELGSRTGATNVWLFVGVNGVGKTTTIGKVARRQVAEGRSVMLAAGDTFRAAAAEQLELWAERAGAPRRARHRGRRPERRSSSTPSSAPRPAKHDLVLADTAGQTAHEGQPHGRAEEDPPGGRPPSGARERGAARPRRHDRSERPHPGAASSPRPSAVTGVVLTKLDGTAKGGIVRRHRRASSASRSSSSGWVRDPTTWSRSTRTTSWTRSSTLRPAPGSGPRRLEVPIPERPALVGD